MTKLTVGLVIMAAACASSGGNSARRAACNLTVRDSVFVAGKPVYRDCAVDRVARRLPVTVHPDFQPAQARTACYGAELEFVVDSAGYVEGGTPRIVRTNDQIYADAVLATVPSWRYEPGIRDGKPVRQIVAQHETMSVAVVIVKAGSGPPGRPPATRTPPSC